MQVHLRTRLHETQSELKLAWDFTLVQVNFFISVLITLGDVKLTSS